MLVNRAAPAAVPVSVGYTVMSPPEVFATPVQILTPRMEVGPLLHVATAGVENVPTESTSQRACMVCHKRDIIKGALPPWTPENGRIWICTVMIMLSRRGGSYLYDSLHLLMGLMNEALDYKRQGVSPRDLCWMEYTKMRTNESTIPDNVFRVFGYEILNVPPLLGLAYVATMTSVAANVTLLFLHPEWKDFLIPLLVTSVSIWTPSPASSVRNPTVQIPVTVTSEEPSGRMMASRNGAHNRKMVTRVDGEIVQPTHQTSEDLIGIE